MYHSPYGAISALVPTCFELAFDSQFSSCEFSSFSKEKRKKSSI